MSARTSTVVILGSSLTALAVLRVARKSGLKCVMLDNMRGPAATTRLAPFVLLEATDVESIAASLRAHGAPKEVAVIADSDRWLRFVSKNHGALEAQGWQVLHPAPDAIDVCLDKSAFLRWCADRGLSAPQLHEIPTLGNLARTAYPVMLRPEWTQHGIPTGLPKAIEIKDSDELRHWLERFAAANVTPCVCESLLRDGLRQFSIGAARNADGSVLTFLAEKVRPRAEQCAGGTFVAPATQSGIEELAAAALNAIEFFGIAEVEILFDPASGRSYLVEINARPWLQYGLPFACGHDLLAHVLMRRSAARPGATHSHAWLYFHSDLYACFSRTSGLLPNRKMGLGEYVRSLIAADVYAMWDWRDPMPLMSSTGRSAIGYLRRLLRLN